MGIDLVLKQGITKKKLLVTLLLIILISNSTTILNTPNAYGVSAGDFNYVIVGGGSGGSIAVGNGAGGGGAGGYLEGSASWAIGTYTVTIGGGANSAGNGGTSVLGALSVAGGGAGGGMLDGSSGAQHGKNGGTGGGGAGSSQGVGEIGHGGYGNPSYNGGGFVASGASAGGGGGGGGSAGVHHSGTTGGNGGDGVYSSITGASVCRAGGGGGAVGGAVGNTAGGGGCGGGKGWGSGTNASSGSANTGGGSGGGNNSSRYGGSGVVIVAYLTSDVTAIGGTISYDGAYTVHTFTTGGTFEITYVKPTPEPPTGLSLIADSISQISLDWDDSIIPLIDNIIGYRIFYESPIGNGWIRQVNDTGTTTSSYTHPSLSSATEYNYMLATINATGVGSNSTGVSIITLPDAPTSLTATTLNSTVITLNWTAPSGVISSYKINQDDVTIVNDTGTTDIAYNATGLSSGVVYDFNVFAYTTGGIGATSNTATNSTDGILFAPVLDSIVRVTNSSLNLFFTNSTGTPVATGWKIERDRGSGFSVLVANTGTGTSNYTDTTLEDDQEATYRGYAINSYGTSPVSNELLSGASPSSTPAPSGGGGGGGGSGGGGASGGGASGGGVPTQPVFETDSLNEFGLVAQLHKLQVGQAQDGELEISWNSPDDLTITQISTEEFTDWFGFRRAPFILEGGDAVSTGVIQYVVRAPAVYCDASKGITLNCAQPIVYTIPITITGNVNGETFTTTTSVKVDLSNNIEPATFMIFIAFAGGVGGIAYRTYTTNKSKSSKSNTGKRKTGGKKGSFLDNLSDLG